MASPDAFTLSARVPHKIADEFKALADSLGLTPNALIKDMVERAVTGQPSSFSAGNAVSTDTDAARKEVAEAQLHFPRMYKVALDLVDELTDAGYPESEIEKALKGIRQELL